MEYVIYWELIYADILLLIAIGAFISLIILAKFGMGSVGLCLAAFSVIFGVIWTGTVVPGVPKVHYALSWDWMIRLLLVVLFVVGVTEGLAVNGGPAGGIIGFFASALVGSILFLFVFPETIPGYLYEMHADVDPATLVDPEGNIRDALFLSTVVARFGWYIVFFTCIIVGMVLLVILLGWKGVVLSFFLLVVFLAGFLFIGAVNIIDVVAAFMREGIGLSIDLPDFGIPDLSEGLEGLFPNLWPEFPGVPDVGGAIAETFAPPEPGYGVTPEPTAWEQYLEDVYG